MSRSIPVILALLLIPLPAASGAGKGVHEAWALHVLIHASDRQIEDSISAYESQASLDDHDRLALGILHATRFIKEERNADAHRAYEHLAKIGPGLAGTPLALVYRGMAAAFKAKIYTIFGVGYLKEMMHCFKAIPGDSDRWFIRFMRGTTCHNVGEALPGIGPLDDYRKAAMAAGKKDLDYVLEQYRANGTETFDPSSYDRSRMPVPLAIRKKVMMLRDGT